MSLCSLRSHFFKHLSYTPTFFTRRIHHIYSCKSLPSRFSPPPSALTEARAQWRLSSIIAMFSTSSSATMTTCSFASPYLSVHIRCRKDVADMLSEALLCFGASSTSMDKEDNYEPDDEVCISSIFPDCQDVDECISHAAASIGLKEMPSYEVIMGNQSDWIKKTQESFHPVEVTEGLWIVPEWRTPPV